MTIDRKFIFTAVNPVNGHFYTQDNAMILCAKDAAAIPALEAYRKACIEIGADPGHVASIELLINRFTLYQASVEKRIPDTIGGEIERCILGNLPERATGGNEG